MQPTVSTISEAGQVEITGSLQASGRLEGGVVYAPAPHVLLAGAGSYKFQVSRPPSYYSQTQQWELGMGSYCHLGRRLLLTGLAGYGQAATAASQRYLLDERGWGAIDMQYNKLFGQAGLTLNLTRVSFSWVSRYVHANFSKYNDVNHYDNTIKPIPLRRMERAELFLCARLRPQWLPSQWQVQTSVGLSGTIRPQTFSYDEDPGNEARWAQFGALLLGAGVVFSPKR